LLPPLLYPLDARFLRRNIILNAKSKPPMPEKKEATVSSIQPCDRKALKILFST